jgi:hypothetical protein
MFDMRTTTAVLLLGCSLLLACNRASQPAETAAKPAPPASSPAPVANTPVPDYEFVPLTQADVDLYLSILREGADKFRHLSPADQASLKAESDYYATLKTGWNPSPNAEQAAIMKRAIEIHHLDYDIAAQRGVKDRYEALASAIEGMVGPEKCGDSDCGQGPDEDTPAARKQQIEDDKKRKAVIKQDLVLLKPHADEILALATEIRLMPREKAARKK